MSRRALTAMTCAAVLAAAAGCGGGGDQGSAQDTAQAYVDARNHGDAAKMCDLLSDQLKRAFVTTNCETFVKEITSGAVSDFKLDGVQVNGDKATAVISATATENGKPQHRQLQVQLERQDGDWKLTGLGGGGG